MDIVQQIARHAAQQQNIIAMMRLPAKVQQEVGVFRNMAEAAGALILPAQVILVQAKKLGTAKMKPHVKVREQAGAVIGVKLALAQLVQNPKYGTATQKKLVREQEQTGAQIRIQLMLRQLVEQQHQHHCCLAGAKNLPAQAILAQKQKHGIVLIKLPAQEQAEAGAPAMVVPEVIAKAVPVQLIPALLQAHGIVSKKRNAKEQERNGVCQHHTEQF